MPADPNNGFTPLHRFSDEPELNDLFLRYGLRARTDIICKGLLPLDCAIGDISYIYEFDRGLPTRHSIYLTIVLVCGLHDLVRNYIFQARHLECSRLLLHRLLFSKAYVILH
ncbi:hypothetical protein V6N13_028330 [Hibiscus sabdariffa]|uniref:Uncharacterized protein n=1 Tax=Hibiscus sabdariffa TaxID=183260 RepID=A0ABR2DAR3_9ROSI